jgi:hypothetical protein
MKVKPVLLEKKADKKDTGKPTEKPAEKAKRAEAAGVADKKN